MPKGDLTPAQRRFVSALWTSKTIEDAAETTGVSRRTGLRWVKMPAVQAALKQEQASNLAGVTRRSVAAMTDALFTLRDITRNAEAPWAARVSAARAILECGLRSTEALDLAERVAALEEK